MRTAVYSPRPASVAVAALTGSLVAPLLTLQAYMFDLFPRLGGSPPSAVTDMVNLLACCLAIALYPLVGLAYSLMERNRHVHVLSKVVGATISASLVLGVQILLGRLMANSLGVDPSADSRSSIEATRAVIGVLVYPILLLGGLMLLGFVGVMASTPVIIYEYAVLRRKAVPQEVVVG